MARAHPKRRYGFQLFQLKDAKQAPDDTEQMTGKFLIFRKAERTVGVGQVAASELEDYRENTHTLYHFLFALYSNVNRSVLVCLS